MYVKKFESDTLDEALKTIKHELGPDAIILKTVTNKGLKGAFKKKRIEITAAISEKNYVKKAKVDNVLSNEQKSEFYRAPANKVSQSIEQYSNHSSPQKAPGNGASYSSVGLNRLVQQTKDRVKSGLDDFLGNSQEEESYGQEATNFQDEYTTARDSEVSMDNYLKSSYSNSHMESQKPVEMNTYSETQASAQNLHQSVGLSEQKNRINELEEKLYELTQQVQKLSPNEPEGIFQLRTTLRSLDLNEKIVGQIIKKAMFELNEEDIRDSDTVYDFALRELEGHISTDHPLFSKVTEDDDPTITLLLSTSASGQTGVMYKLGALKPNSVLISLSDKPEESNRQATSRIFNLEVYNVKTIPEIVAETRKAAAAGKNVFIDYRNSKKELDETKKFVSGIKRGFKHVEVLVCLSAIHSELYNRRELEKLGSLADGTIISHLDLCLNFASIFNVHVDYKELPLKFFGTGEVVPDDIEAASSERLLAGILKFDK